MSRTTTPPEPCASTDPSHAFDHAVIVDAADEIERLRAWKAEATEVIGSWEQVWEALGRPGRLGESKAAAVLRAVKAEGARP